MLDSGPPGLGGVCKEGGAVGFSKSVPTGQDQLLRIVSVSVAYIQLTAVYFHGKYNWTGPKY